ncbi:hypothetical protein AA14337_3123 [Acetobacter malorum DSM 14337]|uniref:Uncharacterized protein n=1 Tax=Acetobacter malorum DSM 14337 TaxID=1307910 RepID=A0ABQ0PZV0_9PROT|nr:hypothetical protein AA14337_3123 [Acetobacter malorum DSM 14337]
MGEGLSAIYNIGSVDLLISALLLPLMMYIIASGKDAYGYLLIAALLAANYVHFSTKTPEHAGPPSYDLCLEGDACSGP